MNSVWYGIARGMIDRGVMSEVALDTLLRIKKITPEEHAELVALWTAKINADTPAGDTPQEATDGTVAP